MLRKKFRRRVPRETAMRNYGTDRRRDRLMEASRPDAVWRKVTETATNPQSAARERFPAQMEFRAFN